MLSLWGVSKAPTSRLPPPLDYLQSLRLSVQDVTAEKSLKMPELYTAGQKEELFNYSTFLQAIAHGTLTSLINFFLVALVSQNMSKCGSSNDYQSFGVMVAISSLLSITLEVGEARTPEELWRPLPDTGIWRGCISRQGFSV